jgi:hypothetical protein
MMDPSAVEQPLVAAKVRLRGKTLMRGARIRASSMLSSHNIATRNQHTYNR